MISAIARTSMRSRASTRIMRSDVHHFPSPNGMNLPFDVKKPGFKFLYWGSCTLFAGLPVLAAWWQIRKGNGSKDY
ncbi:hypothetical protein GGI25_001207 [Coemansia spiralis]|uniref:Cytochrome c oxidase subunit 8, mitochondrial n=2 Tax=Coemansia TaxID=4863 RepID=A0A9W8GBA0_9FUNG|nr:hypothetical protein BX070DRAFT_220790 [Coemansia spiralis]KAJ1994905.1 hypothetical protein EDC05_001280 [Coemansia umbellata]KAJ2624658.1 hypothetical protein GGI26_001352 [Coemansia sp. RSA 1358]KAJ2679756.1 hypothetical protein GGI25_001207 [Coemansia spiralis]